MDKDLMPKAVQPKVSVVIVTYGSSREVPDCVGSLLNQALPIEIFLVDNASPDNTAQVISNYASRYENVHAIFNPENVGLAAGNNAPIGRFLGEYVLVLNPDTFFRDDSLERMVSFLDGNPDVGVVGPRNVYDNGDPHVSCLQSWGIREVVIWRVLPYRLPRALHDHLSSYKTEDVLFVSGSCLLIRRSIFEQIGGYDPEYFLTVEDVVDLCIRVKQTGSRVVFLGKEQVVHHTGRSGQQVPYIGVWHGRRGTVYHFYKHKGTGAALFVSFLLIVAAAARVTIALIPSIFSPRYRSITRIYARVVWNLLVQNPIGEKSRDPEFRRA